VTGPKQRTKGKRYSKVIHRSKTLKVRPGKYKIKAGTVTATGGTDVPTKTTKKVRVPKNKIKTRTVRYVFNALTPSTLQTINFTAPSDAALSDSPVTVSAAATSGLVVAFTSETLTVCTVAGNQVTLLTSGTCTITADQAGDATYAPAPPVTRSFQVGTTCATGDGAANTCVVWKAASGDTSKNIGPGGGKVFYVDENAATGSRYMEAAPNTWDGGSADPGIAWCSNTTTLIAGTFGTAIGTGKTNTDNMVAACTSGAANSVRGYSSPGAPAGSWSLPSKEELNALNVWSLQNPNAGGLTGNRYWSSSQDGATLAWGLSTSAGPGFAAKDSPLSVRPVRAF
jgi:hypothetical protein